MDKESIIELQKIDCNCNDCKFMVRDFEKYQKSLEFHERESKRYFEIVKAKLPPEEQEKAKFQFNRNEAMINFGNCTKLNKQVSFIPNTCQLETQECFEHRRNGQI